MSSPPTDYSYQKLEEKCTAVEKRKWHIVTLLLGFTAIAEMCVTCYFFCYFTDQIDQRLQSDVRNLIYKELKAHNVTSLGPEKPAIHLTGQHRNKPLKNVPPDFAHGDGQDILYWNNVKGYAVHQGGIKYHHGEITIPRNGIYYVYSHVYFWHIPEPDGEDQQYNLFLQYLYKKSMNYYNPILLTKAISTKCWSKEYTFDAYTSFQGALFELQQGDKLFIKVTNASAVDVNEGATYFGAFMIF
ncbi:tumor necrosis factor ligand superfamily member 10-like isoform X2 [Chiloscyllium punctatum]|uniref:tumor necrosis factor ligand superfamily member 10-like isoform X2 n=1 Tax=Chiloscyllium punctatum TaxID=137246 RepID=UPI003B63FDE7